MEINIQKNVSLKNFTTFRIGGNAKYFVEVKGLDELKEAINFAQKKKLKVFVLGGGSDILVSDSGINGLVIKINGNKIRSEKLGSKVLVKADAGVVWDDLVAFTIDNNLQGIECLSGIPGSVGASPVQNIGAYGQELKDSFYNLTAYDTHKQVVTKFDANDCEFAYRESIFKKSENKGKYIITEVTLLLSPNGFPEVKYQSLKNYLNEHGIKKPTLSQVRDAVLEIRKGKFENPSEVGNAGSFFKNPILGSDKMNKLKNKYPDIPCYDFGNGKCKVFAGWFIEKAGLKGFRMGNAAVSPKHALVIINPEGRAGAKDVKKLAEKIIKNVDDKFGIKLKREVQYV